MPMRIFVQSVGGGGGDGGGGNTQASGGVVSVDMTLGGFGGAAGTGGNVTVSNTGTIATQGYESTGIFAQSIGGGGGNGGTVEGSSSASQGLDKSAGVTLGVGGFGAAAARPVP